MRQCEADKAKLRAALLAFVGVDTLDELLKMRKVIENTGLERPDEDFQSILNAIDVLVETML